MAITVAPTIPVVAASNPPTSITDIPSPPGALPNNLLIVISKSSAIFERCRIKPIKMKRGIAINVSRSLSQYVPLKFVIPAFIHSIGPS